ncbi:hypothetical protein AVEN_199839-1 [Araneus ventricosus]|uniref:Helitron helicase-like domain-containing protein n=1 Tax=Araneus ventricosus TaxID=182803 RepID=A0A4Y2DVM0_ARAVE|nr:hypothetical protein AVEN_199839-1 [Araneus ventricosus]
MFCVVLVDFSHVFGRSVRNNDHRKPVDVPLDRANNYRFNDFLIHERYPTVIHLSVHLENCQRVYFTTENAAKRAQAPDEVTLSFFRLCTQDEFAHTLLHNEESKYYTLNNGNKTWQRRKQGQAVLEEAKIRSSYALGRVYTVHSIHRRISKKLCFFNLFRWSI